MVTSSDRAGRVPPFFAALAASVSLSMVFLAVYSGCMWITAQRTGVPTLYFEWERRLPFVPALIIPYLSIDGFFIVAPFLCSTTGQLRVFVQRVVIATVAAGACFLLFPFRFAFARPTTSGWSGALFDWFRAMDRPYNLVPSLHAAYWLLLVQLYWQETRGVARLVVMLWFVAIGLSPVLTYQHHVIDVVSGLLLGAVCIGLRPAHFSSPATVSTS